MGSQVTKIGRFQLKKISETPRTPPINHILTGKLAYFKYILKDLSWTSETLDMTSQGLGEMFEGESADPCAGKIPLVPMGG